MSIFNIKPITNIPVEFGPAKVWGSPDIDTHESLFLEEAALATGKDEYNLIAEEKQLWLESLTPDLRLQFDTLHQKWKSLHEKLDPDNHDPEDPILKELISLGNQEDAFRNLHGFKTCLTCVHQTIPDEKDRGVLPSLCAYNGRYRCIRPFSYACHHYSCSMDDFYDGPDSHSILDSSYLSELVQTRYVSFIKLTDKRKAITDQTYYELANSKKQIKAMYKFHRKGKKAFHMTHFPTYESFEQAIDSWSASHPNYTPTTP